MTTLTEKRDSLIRAMNPPSGRAWSQNAQALNLALFDMAASMPGGWQMAYDVCDDDSEHSPRNTEIFATEHKAHVRGALAQRIAKLGDDDDRADLAAIPQDGHHVLVVLKHESGAQVRRWIDRDELLHAKAPSGRATMTARKDALQAAVDNAIRDVGRARVAAKQRLTAAQNASGHTQEVTP